VDQKGSKRDGQGRKGKDGNRTQREKARPCTTTALSGDELLALLRPGRKGREKKAEDKNGGRGRPKKVRVMTGRGAPLNRSSGKGAFRRPRGSGKGVDPRCKEPDKRTPAIRRRGQKLSTGTKNRRL